MCRLVGWVSKTPMSLHQVLGDDGLAELIALSHVHGDGWGMAWWQGGRLRTKRAPESAHSSAEFSAATREVRSDAVVVHLRWATAGLAVAPENTHPFVAGEHAFGHNGSVRPADGLLDLLPNGTVLSGTTDSERLMHVLLARTAKHGLNQGLRRTVADVGARLTPSSLNALLLGREDLTAICVHASASEGAQPVDGAPPVAGVRPVSEAPEDQPGYFDLRWRQQEDAVVVASEPLGAPGWERLDNGSALVVRRGQLTARTVQIGRLPAAALDRENARRRALGAP